MNCIDLYIYLPNKNNIYNKCYHKTNLQYDADAFLKGLQVLLFSIQPLTIDNVYYIGDDLFQTSHVFDIFQIFQRYKQCFLTVGSSQIIGSTSLFKNYNFSFDFCRAALNQEQNKLILKNKNVPSISQLQEIVEECQNNKIKTRIIVPVQNKLDYDFEKFVSFSKYLSSDIVFRKLLFNKDDYNKASNFFKNSPNIYFDFKENHQILVKMHNDVFVWIENIYTNLNQNNQDYLVFQPNGILLNNFRNF